MTKSMLLVCGATQITHFATSSPADPMRQPIRCKSHFPKIFLMFILSVKCVIISVAKVSASGTADENVMRFILLLWLPKQTRRGSHGSGRRHGIRGENVWELHTVYPIPNIRDCDGFRATLFLPAKTKPERDGHRSQKQQTII